MNQQQLYYSGRIECFNKRFKSLVLIIKPKSNKETAIVTQKSLACFYYRVCSVLEYGNLHDVVHTELGLEHLSTMEMVQTHSSAMRNTAQVGRLSVKQCPDPTVRQLRRTALHPCHCARPARVIGTAIRSSAHGSVTGAFAPRISDSINVNGTFLFYNLRVRNSLASYLGKHDSVYAIISV